MEGALNMNLPSLDLCFSIYKSMTNFVFLTTLYVTMLMTQVLHICDKDLTNLLKSLEHDTHIAI